MPAEISYEIDGRHVAVPLDRDELTIGRDARNDVAIPLPSISRRHARIYRDGAAWRVADLGSLNGTRINDLRDTAKALEDGDTIYLHGFPLRFCDRSGGGSHVSLTAEMTIPSTQTVVQSAVDFVELAARPPDTQRLQRLLTVVTRASEAILSSGSLDETFERVLGLVFEHLPVERGCIMLWDDERQDLVARCVRRRGGGESAGEIRFSRTIAEKVYRDKVAVYTVDAQTDGRFADGASVFELGIHSAMAAPLWQGETVDGLIYADTLSLGAFDKFDLDLLSALGNHLAVAIERARLQRSIVEQQLVRRRLERYHSPAVVEAITAGSGAGQMLMAEERDVTVMFADVVGFTARCEQLEPRAVAELLNRYFSEMSERIFNHQGTLDKFIGDCIMAVFGAPLAVEDHARRAVEAALEMREALARLNEPVPVAARVQFRVGLHSGRVIAGDIGSMRRTDYTVLGATVNLAARLESSVARPDQIVVSEATRLALGAGYVTGALGEHQLRGFAAPVLCHELLGRTA